MTRGKYAHRSDNREIARLTDTLAQRDATIAELLALHNATEATLAQERKTRADEVTRRADEQAAEQLKAARERYGELEAKHVVFGTEVADWLINFLTGLKDVLPDNTPYLPRDVLFIFDKLVGERRTGEYLCQLIGEGENFPRNRNSRRSGKAARLADRAADGRAVMDRRSSLVVDMMEAQDGQQRDVASRWALRQEIYDRMMDTL